VRVTPGIPAHRIGLLLRCGYWSKVDPDLGTRIAHDLGLAKP
jgi:hypothetical protein